MAGDAFINRLAGRSRHPPAPDVLRAPRRRPAAARGRGARRGARPSPRARHRRRARRGGRRRRLCPAPRARAQRRRRSRPCDTTWRRRSGRASIGFQELVLGDRAAAAPALIQVGGLRHGAAARVSARLRRHRRRARPDDRRRRRGTADPDRRTSTGEFLRRVEPVRRQPAAACTSARCRAPSSDAPGTAAATTCAPASGSTGRPSGSRSCRSPSRTTRSAWPSASSRSRGR